MWLLYQLGIGLLLLFAGPVLLVRRGQHYLQTLPARLGRYADDGAEPLRDRSDHASSRPLWLHAVSVGEVGVATTLARGLPQELPLLVTTVTPTGQGRARAAFAGRGTVSYLPFELGFAVRAFFERYSPRALVLIEGELWPLVLRTAERHDLPIVMVNGRISDRTFRRMRHLKPWLGVLFDPIDRFAVQSDQDRDRLIELGVASERVATTGNLKYETPEPPRLAKLESQIDQLADGRAVLVAGSTMANEDGLVIEAFRAAGGSDRALLILAPRHPERNESVYQLLVEAGLSIVRRSTLDAAAAPASRSIDQRPAVLLLDSLGELASLYRIAAAAFIGGTLVPTGGHNPLEAARFGIATAVGPSMENFLEMSEHFDRAEAWGRVDDAADLGRLWRLWLESPEQAQTVGDRARALVERHRGALERTLVWVGPSLGLPNTASDTTDVDMGGTPVGPTMKRR